MEPIFISKPFSKAKMFPMLLARLLFYSFGLLYLICSPESRVSKLIFFVFMITLFLIIIIKIPELIAQEAADRSLDRIVYHDKSVQHILNTNKNQTDLQEPIRYIPVNIDVLLAISILFIGIIIMIL